jgi:hypothetical protein
MAVLGLNDQEHAISNSDIGAHTVAKQASDFHAHRKVLVFYWLKTSDLTRKNIWPVGSPFPNFYPVKTLPSQKSEVKN